ncbi:hypothetical protein KJ865_06535, partial [Myxococcota bacterium]|nr:hypothetical protein [Myxococcota bacterium]
MNRFLITLRSPPGPNPPGWTLYGQEVVGGNSLNSTLLFPLGKSGGFCFHLYEIAHTLYGERLSGEVPVTMNGTLLRQSESIALPDSFTLNAGPHLFTIIRERVEIPETEAGTLL